jgi:acid phosphatase (class A)
MNKRDLNLLRYNSGPTDKHREKMSRDTPLINIQADDIRFPNPPMNFSEETFLELKALEKAINNSSREDFIFADMSDDKPVDVIKSFARENNLTFDEKYFNDLEKQLATLILNLKYRFNRPRPDQISREYKVSIPGKDISTAGSPSYPSGHAIQAHVITGILSQLNPGNEQSLENLADRIALGRIQTGVHYPSDVDIGKEVAYMIEPYIVGPMEANGLSLKSDDRRMIREFLFEVFEEGPEKLRILDFDDTIANTTERVFVTTDYGKGMKPISSKEFATYDLLPGESIDRSPAWPGGPEVAFQEFSQIDIDAAQPVPFVSDLLRTFTMSPGNRKVLILTARGNEVRPFVMRFLEERLGIPNPEGKVDFIGVEDKDPMAKVREIETYLDQNPSIGFVSFYDDSGKNVRAVSNFLDARGIKKDVRQVVKDEEGNITLVATPKELSEDADFRSITRKFLKSL